MSSDDSVAGIDFGQMNPDIDRRILERFWAKVDAEGDCWVWTAGRSMGYGMFSPTAQRRGVRPHRFVFEVLLEPVPPHLHVDHRCLNKLCLNPAHLEPVTLAENIRRGFGPAQVTQRTGRCRRGHTMADAIRHGRSRECRTCRHIARGIEEGAIRPRSDGTACRRGHPMIGDNVRFVRHNGRVERTCVTCRRATSRAYEARKRRGLVPS